MPVRYPDDEALKEAVKEWLEGQTDFYVSGINSLSEQESCAIAKMTAQCALYMVP